MNILSGFDSNRFKEFNVGNFQSAYV